MRPHRSPAHWSCVRRHGRRVEEDLGDFRAGKLDGGSLPVLEHLPDFGSAKDEMVGAIVGARPARRHSLTGVTVEGVFERDRLDADVLRSETFKDPLGVVGAVVVADAGVVAADDQMGATVVLATQRVKDGLSGAGVTHARREGGEKHTIGRIVSVY